MGKINPEWARAAAAAAIDPTTLSPVQLFELYGKLLHDPEVVRIRRQHAVGLHNDALSPEEVINSELSVEQAIRSMTRYERLDLKERVTGVIAFKKPITSEVKS